MSDILTSPPDTSVNSGREIVVQLSATVAKWPQLSAIAAADEDGLCVSAAAAGAEIVLGRLERILPADASAGREATAIIHRGPVSLLNDATHPVLAEHLYLTATLGDNDASAAAPDETRLNLGKILQVDSARVLVEIL